jgi:SagB-type dehydrogenase family enzyme
MNEKATDGSERTRAWGRPRRVGRLFGCPGGLAGAACTLLTLTIALFAEGGGERTVMELPEPVQSGVMSVEEAIARRRSVRSFAENALPPDQISQLLWAAQGITERRRQLRAAPSAGATYPLETYLVTGEGVFRYLPARHALERAAANDVRPALAEAALGQTWVRAAPASIVFAAVPERTTGRYGRRGMVYIFMEAGHAAQNVHLQAVALGLSSVPVGAFNDDEVASVVGLAEGEIPLYIVSIGKQAAR